MLLASDRASPFRIDAPVVLPTSPPARPDPNPRFIALPNHDVSWSGRPGWSEPQLGVEADAGRGPCPPFGTEAEEWINVRLPDALVRCCHRDGCTLSVEKGFEDRLGDFRPLVGLQAPHRRDN